MLAASVRLIRSFAANGHSRTVYWGSRRGPPLGAALHHRYGLDMNRRIVLSCLRSRRGRVWRDDGVDRYSLRPGATGSVGNLECPGAETQKIAVNGAAGRVLNDASSKDMCRGS